MVTVVPETTASGVVKDLRFEDKDLKSKDKDKGL